ncbi:autophagy protein 16 [Amniculicola lignicola CBS 123094]|uniref:Autophagy protein 16 n=1 Tax=Amniculicola lignicola CBS 123094 TaxID=1392246 RepID=A0A6A5WJ22_9PLEO|nr:autophagy protein 16 [Amniculicola lignicola CBS 123094]
MSSPMSEYLSALSVRDAREQREKEVYKTYTKLADRLASTTKAVPASTDAIPPSPSTSTKSLRPGTPKGKPSPAPADTASPSSLAQIRSELAATQKLRSSLESQISALTAEVASLTSTTSTQTTRITHLERVKQQLERRGKDQAEELKAKGRLVEEVQDEQVALTLELSQCEKEITRLTGENEELTRRWVEKMEGEARRMNERSGWEDQPAGAGAKGERRK